MVLEKRPDLSERLCVFVICGGICGVIYIEVRRIEENL